MTRPGTTEEGKTSQFLNCLYLLLTVLIKGHESLDFVKNK